MEGKPGEGQEQPRSSQMIAEGMEGPGEKETVVSKGIADMTAAFNCQGRGVRAEGWVDKGGKRLHRVQQEGLGKGQQAQRGWHSGTQEICGANRRRTGDQRLWS